MAERPDPIHIDLTQLLPGERGRICGINNPEQGESVVRRLLELGFDEGIEVELLHKGLFGGNPLSVRVGDSTVALRRAEAARVRLAPRP
jgi:ferrous iron transport protein A